MRIRERSSVDLLDAAGCRARFRRLVTAALQRQTPDEAVLRALDAHCGEVQRPSSR